MKIKSIIYLAILLTATICIAKDKDTKIKPPRANIHAATIQGNLKAIQQHIDAGSDLNVKDPTGGSTPLITAAVFGKTEIAKALIDAGADLNMQNNDGSTALITAAFFCQTEIVKMLLDKGADKSITSNAGSTALQSVLAPYEHAKPIYEQIEKALSPLGFLIDYKHLEETRPMIAELLKESI